MTTLLRTGLTKRLNDVLNFLRSTWRLIRALNNLVKLYKRRAVQPMKFRRLEGMLQYEFFVAPTGMETKIAQMQSKH